MMRAVAAVAVVSACSFQPRGEAPPVGSGGVQPTEPDAQVDVDTDGDGVPDRLDNCPTTANADQRDHDVDGRGDACDVCPHIADDGADGDGDGVGDACDPRPADPGDRIAFFEGFYAPVAWTSVIGGNTWATADGALDQPSADDEHQIVRDDVSIGGAGVFVQARMQVHQVSTDDSSRRSAGLVLGYHASDDYYFCGLAAADTASELDAGKVSGGLFGASFDYLSTPVAQQMVGDWTILTARLGHDDSGATLDCRSARGSDTQDRSYATDDHDDGKLGVRTNGAAVDFDYVFVVAVGGT